jgi:hypothetical protein
VSGYVRGIKHVSGHVRGIKHVSSQVRGIKHVSGHDRDINFASFYDFPFGFLNCSKGVEILVFHCIALRRRRHVFTFTLLSSPLM